MKDNSFINWIKSYKKWFIWIIVIGIVGTGIGLLSVNWTNLKIIYAAGSSAVSPLLEELNYTYRNITKKNVDMNVLPTGSGNGIESIVDNTKNIGNISRSPTIEETGLPQVNNTPAVNGTYSKQWEDNKLKTITWGWDSICIIYKPHNKDFVLDINNNNILDLYKCISGEATYDLNHFKSSSSPSNDNSTIIPFARTGGAVKSGTTEAFIKSSHFSNANWNDIKNDSFIKVLENGNFPNNVHTTKESNIETWKTISIDGSYGSMTYLSGGFVLSNLNDILNAGFKIATYNNISLEKQNVTNGYNWYRPLNSIVSTNAPDYVKNWIFWVVSNEYNENQAVLDTFNKINVIPLNKNQINSLCKDNNFNEANFWYSDYELYELGKTGVFGASENNNSLTSLKTYIISNRRII